MLRFIYKLIPDKTKKRLEALVSAINEREKDVKKLDDSGLRKASLALQRRAQNGESLDVLLPDAFALVREASRRTLGQRHFDVQLMGGIVLHEGKIAEMATGEGKTLAATAPAYLNALQGHGVHVVTVNDYLARRDTVWMGQIYHALGLTVSCIVHDGAFRYDPEVQTSAEVGSYGHEGMDDDRDKKRDMLGSFKVEESYLRPISRKDAYAADITYGTNHEFGFDYLRDNLVVRLHDRVQREHHYAIIDEVDSILIDEARTPLIIAAPDTESSEYYRIFARAVAKLSPGEDYEVDEKLKAVSITNSGIEKIERMLGVENIYDPKNARLVHFLEESLKAKALYERDKQYVVKQGEVLIVDEFTGRILLGRRFSGGLHQAIEAKEGVPVRQENRTFAQITIQNYFRLYKKIAGMTGTAETSAEEFHKVYNLDVVSIPTNRPLIRKDLPDVVYKTRKEKYDALVKDIQERHRRGQPVLVGTTSISNNEVVSRLLSKAGIPHEVLNAKNHEREGAIIAQAGARGAVTVATNMAGRGVDIILGGTPFDAEKAEEVKKLGGLYVCGTERHEARRIDNQLRGRAGRQGDPGMSRFYLSLEDDLLRVFGGERIRRLMQTLKFPEGVPIESRIVSKAVNQAQQKVEGANFDMRKHLLEYDDILNKQRNAIYERRKKFLELAEKNELQPALIEILSRAVDSFRAAGNQEFLDEEAKNNHRKKLEEAEAKLEEVKNRTLEPERARMVGEQLVRILDMLWVDHLEYLDSLRQSVNIRAYGQHEPLVEYRREAYQLYQNLTRNFDMLAFNACVPLLTIDLQKLKESREKQAAHSQNVLKKVGRNAPCPCGSGKKYKRCHGT